MSGFLKGNQSIHADDQARDLGLLRRSEFSIISAGAGITAYGGGSVTAGTPTSDTAATGGPISKYTSAASVNALALVRGGTSFFGFNDKPRLLARFQPYNLGGARARYIVGLHSNGSPVDDTYATNRCLALRHSASAGDTTWKILTCDGTSGTVLDTGVTGSTNQWMALFDCGNLAAPSVRLWEYTGGAWVARGSFVPTGTLPTGNVGTQSVFGLVAGSSVNGTALDTGFGYLKGYFDTGFGSVA